MVLIGNIKIDDEIAKIDNLSTDGLGGINNSLAYRIHEIENHLHSPERRLGISLDADQAKDKWALEDTLNTYQAISGNSIYGADTDDEAKLIGIDDGPYVANMIKFDMHKIFITALSSDNPYAIRVIWGIRYMTDAIAAGQFTHSIVVNNPAGSKASGTPIEVMMPRLTWGVDKVWVQCKCATDNATMDFYVLLHEYIG